jgi:hypothetical protein
METETILKSFTPARLADLDRTIIDLWKFVNKGFIDPSPYLIGWRSGYSSSLLDAGDHALVCDFLDYTDGLFDLVMELKYGTIYSEGGE